MEQNNKIRQEAEERAEKLQKENSKLYSNYDVLKEHEVNDISQELLERCACLISNVDVAKVNLPGSRFLRRKQQRLFIS